MIALMTDFIIFHYIYEFVEEQICDQIDDLIGAGPVDQKPISMIKMEISPDRKCLFLKHIRSTKLHKFKNPIISKKNCATFLII